MRVPQGSGGVTIRITGRTLNAALVEALPEPGSWLRAEPEASTDNVPRETSA